MHFLFPHIRVELLIRTILTRQWDDKAWARGPARISEGFAAQEFVAQGGLVELSEPSVH